ncbi:MAG: hypothetical protein HY858_16050 [Candidatus Solibacter usitatus]|nr:hypothetical protein [Candidatus Solibacter usitatus]
MPLSTVTVPSSAMWMRASTACAPASEANAEMSRPAPRVEKNSRRSTSKW